MNPKIDSKGHKYWYNDKGQLHRVGGPAIEYVYGNKEWYQNGIRHRLDGPAYISVLGIKFWLINGKLDRLDGPAIEYTDGHKEYWINDKEYTHDSLLDYLLK